MNEELQRLPEIYDNFYAVGIPGLTARLIARTDKKAIYYRWDDYYEVFRIKIDEAQEIFGRAYPRREVYPSNEDFGMTAWCFKSKRLAMKRYKVL